MESESLACLPNPRGNHLKFSKRDSRKDRMYSDKFMQLIGKFFKLAEFINHIDFSNINFNRSNFFEVIEMLKKC